MALVVLFGAMTFVGCEGRPDSAEPAGYDAAGVSAMIERAKRTPDVEKRGVLWQEVMAAARADSDDDRKARRHLHDAMEQLAALRESQGRRMEADQLRQRRRQSQEAAIARDPGDGFSRGQLAYELGLERRFDIGWQLLLEGVERTDPTDYDENALLHYASTLPALQLRHGGTTARTAAIRRQLQLTEGLLKRARTRKVSKEHEARLLYATASGHVSLVQWDEAERHAVACERLQPGDAEILKLLNLIKAGRKN